MLATLVLSLAAILGGAALSYLYDQRACLATRVATGVCTGYVLLGSVASLCACFWGLDRCTLLAATATVSLPLALLFFRQVRAEALTEICLAAAKMRSRLGWREVGRFIFCGFLVLLLWRVFDRAMFESGGEVFTGFRNNLGDLPFHLQVISSFVHGHNLPPEDPTYAGVRFTYPFISDIIAATFVRCGATLRQAMFMENIALILALLVVLHRWTWELTKDRMACLLAPLLLLLSGGFGWVLFFRDAAHSSEGFLNLLAHPPRDYTLGSSDLWRWGNCLTTLLVPQRALLLGLPVAICIFTQWWLWVQEEDATSAGGGAAETLGSNRPVAAAPLEVGARLRAQQRKHYAIRRMIAAGAMTGLLPLIHTHTFLVVMAVASCLLFIFRRWFYWATFFATAVVVATPELLWLARGSAKAQSFLGWHLGWESGNHNLIWFWFVNTGAFIPLLVCALLWREKKYLVQAPLLHYYVPFLLCLIVPNLLRLAPWPWDNIKVLIYWYLASVPLVALVLALWHRKKGAWRAASYVFLFVLTLAGTLDIWRAIGGTTSYREFDRDQISIADEIRQKTPPRALVLHAPTFNSPIFLTGRRSLLGYPGWAWSRGLQYTDREAEIQRIYRGDADAPDLMRSEHVDYVMIGPVERVSMSANEAFFGQYVKIAEHGTYRLYRVSLH